MNIIQQITDPMLMNLPYIISAKLLPLVQRAPKQTVFNPFRDGIWNRRQLSVGDGGSFPHDPVTVRDMPS